MSRLIARYTIGIALIFVLVAVAADCPKNRGRLEEVTHNPSVVLLDYGRSVCSGFIAQQDTIVTAGHCGYPLTGMGMVIFSDDSVAPFVVLVRELNAAQDFAILHALTGKRPALPLSSIAPDPFTVLSQIGHPDGSRDQLTTRGIMLGGRSFFFIASSTIPGESGGPVLDPEGRVVGILRAVFTPPTITEVASIEPVVQSLARLGKRK